MENEQYLDYSEENYGQLTQIRVPLEDAAAAFFVRDASGRIPIVVMPQRKHRIRVELIVLAALVLVGGVIGPTFVNAPLLLPLSIVIALLLTVLALYSAFRVRIPEGVQALLARGGRYTGTVGSGMHFVPPWVAVTHLVTRREIPFDVPVVEAPTQDDVWANVDTLITFTISEPYQFVYNISADDFDRVFQAVCQDSLRAMVRQITADQINDLARLDLSELRQTLSAGVEPYGVTIMKVNIVYAQPPAEFMRSREARQLAVFQQAEQAEKQALALRRQTDEAALARAQVIARVEQEREELQLGVQQAEARRRVIELDAENEDMRLVKLEERLHRYPLAVKWEWQGDQLAVARSLAANSRAVVQLGDTDALVRMLLMRDVATDSAPNGLEDAGPDEAVGTEENS